MSLPNPTPQATVNLRHALKETIDAGRRILIVGCPPGTFEHWMMRHPALMFWPSSEAKVSDDRRLLPAEVGSVLLTSMMSFALSANVKSQAKERGITCPSDTFSPGAVRRLLVGIVSRDDEKKHGAEMPRPTEVRRVPDAPAQVQTLNDEGQSLLSAIDDAKAALDLVRERTLAYALRMQAVEEQLQTLDTLKKLLK